MNTIRRACVAAALMLVGWPLQAAAPPEPEVVVFAAASLSDVLQDIGTLYTAATGQKAQFSFAASSVLARQIEAGTRADVFVSADAQWMDYLQKRNLIEPASRHDVAAGRLVLIAAAGSPTKLAIAPHFALAATLGAGRLATGDPESVPAGRYARAALTSLGVWDSVADRLVRADNVRSALAFVARGDATLGIVYETDAFAEKRVRILGVFPESSHPPIRYPAAVTSNAQSGGLRFAVFLRSKAARTEFAKFGFRDPD